MKCSPWINRHAGKPSACWRLPPLFDAPPFWMYVAGFLLVLGPLVTVHELGHLLIGRLFGVKAEAFSVGFGKEIAGFTDRQGTRWKLSALPLGGYVQFQGDMNPASVPDTNAPREEGSFQHAALWKRALIVAAGPVTQPVGSQSPSFAAFYAHARQACDRRAGRFADHRQFCRSDSGARCRP